MPLLISICNLLLIWAMMRGCVWRYRFPESTFRDKSSYVKWQFEFLGYVSSNFNMQQFQHAEVSTCESFYTKDFLVRKIIDINRKELWEARVSSGKSTVNHKLQEHHRARVATGAAAHRRISVASGCYVKLNRITENANGEGIK